MVETKRPTMQDIKAQFRMERHREFLTVALRIVTEEGLNGLTMQGLAEELGCGNRTLYVHFPSKSALIAELQRESLDIINTSFRLSQAHLDELLGARKVRKPATIALARVVTAARFWVTAGTVFPQEVDLSRRMFIDPALDLDAEEATRVVPAALRMLDLARGLLEDAVVSGALEDGRSARRAVILVSATTGVLMTGVLGAWDEEAFDGPNLSSELVRDLFRGWGADRAELTAVEALIDDLAEHGHLVPAVRR